MKKIEKKKFFKEKKSKERENNSKFPSMESFVWVWTLKATQTNMGNEIINKAKLKLQSAEEIIIKKTQAPIITLVHTLSCLSTFDRPSL